MPGWTSVEEVVRRFKLEMSPASDVSALIEELRDRLVKSHPDRLGGEFPNAEAKEEFMSLQSAITYLEGLSSAQSVLVPFSQQSVPVEKVINTILQQIRVLPLPEALHAEAVESLRAKLKDVYRVPRVTSTSAFVATTAIFTFIRSDHPMLGFLASNSIAKVVVVAAWIIAGGISLVLWWRERSAQAQAEHLLSEEVLEEIFRLLCKLLYRPSQKSNGIFSVKQLADLIEIWWNSGPREAERYANHEIHYPSHVRYGIFPQLVKGRLIDSHVARRVADTQIAALVQRQVVRSINSPGVRKQYAIESLQLEQYARPNP